MIANTPKTPYYAVVFTSVLADNQAGYEEEAALIMTLAKTQKGFLGVESARNDVGITVSYWESLEAIAEWSKNSRHQVAKHKGKTSFYEAYKTRICRVEKEY